MRTLEALKARVPLLTKSDLALWKKQLTIAQSNVEAKHAAYTNAAPIHRIDMVREFIQSERVLNEAKRVLANHQLVEPPADQTVVDIGLVVTGQHYDYDGNALGTSQTFRIGGYGSSDLNATPPVYSYDSRVVLDLLGHKVGHDCCSFRGKLATMFEIQHIRRLEDAPVIIESDQNITKSAQNSLAA